MVHDCSGPGVYCDAAENYWIQNVWSERNGGPGIDLKNGEIFLKNFVTYDNKHVFRVLNQVEGLWVDSVRAAQPNGIGIYIGGGGVINGSIENIEVINSGANNTGSATLDISGDMTRVDIRNLWVDGQSNGNTGHAIEFSSGTYDGLSIKNVHATGISSTKYNDAGGAQQLGYTIDGKGPRTALDGITALPSYTGDGTTGRTVNLGFTPNYVAVRGSDGTWYDVHSEFGNGYQHNSPSGELSISAGGITVGDNGSDADPNTDTEPYDVYFEV